MLWVPPLFALMKAGEDLCRPPCRICRLPPSRICSADHSRFLTSATTYFLWSQISENGSILFVVGISTNVILSHPRTEHLENPEPYLQISKHHRHCYHHHPQHHVHHHRHNIIIMIIIMIRSIIITTIIIMIVPSTVDCPVIPFGPRWSAATTSTTTDPQQTT